MEDYLPTEGPGIVTGVAFSHQTHLGGTRTTDRAQQGLQSETHQRLTKEGQEETRGKYKACPGDSTSRQLGRVEETREEGLRSELISGRGQD